MCPMAVTPSSQPAGRAGHSEMLCRCLSARAGHYDIHSLQVVELMVVTHSQETCTSRLVQETWPSDMVSCTYKIFLVQVSCTEYSTALFQYLAQVSWLCVTTISYATRTVIIAWVDWSPRAPHTPPVTRSSILSVCQANAAFPSNATHAT